LSASTIPALLVEGNNKAGLGYAITKALSDAGINLEFVVGQVVGRKQSTVIGFESGDDARRAVPLIRKAASAQKSNGLLGEPSYLCCLLLATVRLRDGQILRCPDCSRHRSSKSRMPAWRHHHLHVTFTLLGFCSSRSRKLHFVPLLKKEI